MSKQPTQPVCDRMLEAIKAMHMTKAAAFSKAGIVPSAIYYALRIGKDIGVATSQRFLDAFPNVSSDWLYNGAGEMFIGNDAAFVSEVAEREEQSRKTIAEMKAQIDLLIATIAKQQETIAKLVDMATGNQSSSKNCNASLPSPDPSR